MALITIPREMGSLGKDVAALIGQNRQASDPS